MPPEPPLKLKCAYCAQSLSATEDLFGMTLKCPLCSAPVIVPSPAVAVVPTTIPLQTDQDIETVLAFLENGPPKIDIRGHLVMAALLFVASTTLYASVSLFNDERRSQPLIASQPHSTPAETPSQKEQRRQSGSATASGTKDSQFGRRE